MILLAYEPVMVFSDPISCAIPFLFTDTGESVAVLCVGQFCVQEVFVLFLIFYSFPSKQFVYRKFFTIVPAFQPTLGRARRPCITIIFARQEQTCLDFSLSLLAGCGSVGWLCRMRSGSKELRLAKEIVASWRRSSAGGMPERTGRLSIGVGRRHLVTMRKASSKKLSIRQVCALRHQANAHYLAVE